ncbi:hypothetical protein [Shewanella algae]|uniref:hypothetical protein n=1 Tax=Shewanella algae TaxID=38313 RepID=UPI001AAE6D1A|nr:hypothetical protein [Shewanella algae]MBO2550340.1 hypothetical protein [Shewanella algae]
MNVKKFIGVTAVLYLSSLVSYYAQIKIIDIYGLEMKYYFDLYISYLQITITLVIFGLPNAISIMVSKEKVVPRFIKRYSFALAALSALILNLFFLEGNFFVYILLFSFIFMSLFNDLNTGIMNSIGMFEYPRIWQLFGNALLLCFVILDPFNVSLLTGKSQLWYALIFILIPVLPLFFVLTLGRKFKTTVLTFKSVSMASVFKYLNYIYLFSILSIILTRIPYINYSSFIEKHDLAQYTLSISLSNFMVIPLNLLTLKVLSSSMERKPNVGLLNILLISIVVASALVLNYVSKNFNLLHALTNISSPEILTSTYFLIATASISSINLSVSLRLQEKLKSFLLLDLLLVGIVVLITLNLVHEFKNISDYNYTIVIAIFAKIVFQVYFLREKNVHNHNCKL